MAGFAEGLAAGSGVISNAVNIYTKLTKQGQDDEQYGRLQKDQQFADALKGVMGAAAADPSQSLFPATGSATAGPATQVSAPASSGMAPQPVSTDTAATAPTPVGADPAPPPLSTVDTANASTGVAAAVADGAQAAGNVAVAGGVDGGNITADKVAAGAAATAAPATSPQDHRQPWQVKVDAFTAGARYSMEHGQVDKAVALTDAALATRSMGAQQMAQTGYRQLMSGGGADGLVSAFNSIDDGVKVTGVVENPLAKRGDTQTYTLNFANPDGSKTWSQTISRDNLPNLVDQYFDPKASYARQRDAVIGRSSTTFTTNEGIRKDVAVAQATEEAKRRGTKPEITKLSMGNGLPERAIITAPTDTGWQTRDVDGTGAPADAPPPLTENDQKMHDDIRTTASLGKVGNSMSPLNDKKQAQLDQRIVDSQGLYDANKAVLGPGNDSHWIAAADAIRAGGKDVTFGTMTAPGGAKVRAATWNGVTYALPTTSPTGNVAAPPPVAGTVMPSPRASAAAQGVSPAGFPKVAPAVQAARDTDRVRILTDELQDKQSKLPAMTAKAATNPGDKDTQDDLARLKSDIASIQTEMAPKAAPMNSTMKSRNTAPETRQQQPSPANLPSPRMSIIGR